MNYSKVWRPWRKRLKEFQCCQTSGLLTNRRYLPGSQTNQGGGASVFSLVLFFLGESKKKEQLAAA